jgi:uncharacterized protein
LGKQLSKLEIEDLIVGATLLGTGGGGDPDNGLKAVMEQFDSGRKVVVSPLSEFSRSDRLASPYFVGSVAPSASSPKTQKPRIVKDPIARAVELLETKLATKISGTIATEIGGGNTAASLAVAAKLGIPAVDGDLMGRAGPELHQSTTHIFGISMAPAAIVSETGNEFLVEKYASIDDYEAIARYASVISGGHVAVVDTPITIPQGEQCVVKGTISRCIKLGQVRRGALDKKEDPVNAIVKQLPNGKRIFEGAISDYTWKDEKGFLFGEAHVQGSGQFRGKSLKSWIMNEHIMCWINEKPAVMPPDLVIFVEPATGLGITNDRLKKGMAVVVLASSIDPVWRVSKGLELFGPRRFNFNYDYVPFEQLST